MCEQVPLGVRSKGRDAYLRSMSLDLRKWRFGGHQKGDRNFGKARDSDSLWGTQVIGLEAPFPPSK